MQLLSLVQRAARIPLHEVIPKLSYHLPRRCYLWQDRRAVQHGLPSAHDLLSASLVNGLTPETYAAQFATRSQPRWFASTDNLQNTLAAWQNATPGAVERLIAAADQIADGTYALLGSGPVRIGAVPDWHADFKSGYRWPLLPFGSESQLVKPDQHADIKVPWDLSRALHWLALGVAWRATRKSRYAEVFTAQLADWLTSNPYLRGVNWASAMEVGIRAVNWLWAYHLFADCDLFCDLFTPELRVNLIGALVLHGRFLYRYHDYLGGYTTNHHLAGLSALVYLGLMLPEVRESRRWLRFGLSHLQREIMRQSHPDGMIYESSISYHGLSLEILLWTTILLRRNGYHWPDAVQDRLKAMVRFTASVIRPDGSVPLIGDADNGHWHLFRWPDPVHETLDHRHLLSLGAAALGETCLFEGSPEPTEAIWAAGVEQPAHSTVPAPAAFPHSGFYVLRGTDAHVVVDCGMHQQGSGHGHNDTLSFEFYAQGRVWVRDPGSYLYSADPPARNRFRSTAMHNTLQVDGCEQNDLQGLFLLARQAFPTVQHWQEDTAAVSLEASHSGYTRLAQPVTHRRTFTFDRTAGWLRLDDVLVGSGTHNVAAFLHLDAGLTAAPVERAEITGCSGAYLVRDEHDEQHDEQGRGLIIAYWCDNPSAQMAVETGAVSPSYGVRHEAIILAVRAQAVAMPFMLTTLLWPFKGEPPFDLVEAVLTK